MIKLGLLKRLHQLFCKHESYWIIEINDNITVYDCPECKHVQIIHKQPEK